MAIEVRILITFGGENYLLKRGHKGNFQSSTLQMKFFNLSDENVLYLNLGVF